MNPDKATGIGNTSTLRGQYEKGFKAVQLIPNRALCWAALEHAMHWDLAILNINVIASGSSRSP